MDDVVLDKIASVLCVMALILLNLLLTDRVHNATERAIAAERILRRSKELLLVTKNATGTLCAQNNRLLARLIQLEAATTPRPPQLTLPITQAVVVFGNTSLFAWLRERIVFCNPLESICKTLPPASWQSARP